MHKFKWFLLIALTSLVVGVACAPGGNDDDDDDSNSIGVTPEQLAPFVGVFQFRTDAAENAEILEESDPAAATVTTIFDLEASGDIFVFQVGADQECHFVQESGVSFSVSEDNQILNIMAGEASVQFSLSANGTSATMTPLTEGGEHGHEHADGGEEGEEIYLDPFVLDEPSVWAKIADLPEACEEAHDHGEEEGEEHDHDDGEEEEGEEGEEHDHDDGDEEEEGEEGEEHDHDDGDEEEEGEEGEEHDHDDGDEEEEGEEGEEHDHDDGDEEEADGEETDGEETE